MLHALIHTAKEVGRRRAVVRNAQGEYPDEPYEGPSFACRLMERGVAPKRRRPDRSSAQVERGLELLAAPLDDLGGELELKASMEVLVVAPPVTVAEGKRYRLSGDPELLNNGVDRIGWLANVVELEEAV